ncbi:MAG: hypothetical protein AB7I52_03655 [Rhizobiaceae bacterium]
MNAYLTTGFVIVSHTPLWVWALYALLLFLGFQRTRDSSVALWRALTLPSLSPCSRSLASSPQG